MFRQRRTCLVDDRLGPAFADRNDQAELVAAEPVCPFGSRHHGGKLRAEAGEQRISGGMAEGVVVPLEAVEVEDHQQAAWRVRSVEQAIEIRQEPSAISETGQRVGDRFVPGELEEPAVLAEGHCEPDDDREQRRRRQAEGEQVDPVEVVVDEDADGQESASCRNRQQRLALDLATTPVGGPRG